MDSVMTIPGKSHLGMTGPGTMPRSPMQPRARGRKAKRAKEKASMEKMAKMEKEAPRTELLNLPMLLQVQYAFRTGEVSGN